MEQISEELKSLDEMLAGNEDTDRTEAATGDAVSHAADEPDRKGMSRPALLSSFCTTSVSQSVGAHLQCKYCIEVYRIRCLYQLDVSHNLKLSCAIVLQLWGGENMTQGYSL